MSFVITGGVCRSKQENKKAFPPFQLFFGMQKSQNIWSNMGT